MADNDLNAALLAGHQQANQETIAEATSCDSTHTGEFKRFTKWIEATEGLGPEEEGGSLLATWTTALLGRLPDVSLIPTPSLEPLMVWSGTRITVNTLVPHCTVLE